MAAPDVFMDTAGLGSFTDCVSFALMHELKIQDSFTTDHHFTQAGFNPLLRSAT